MTSRTHLEEPSSSTSGSREAARCRPPTGRLRQDARRRFPPAYKRTSPPRQTLGSLVTLLPRSRSFSLQEPRNPSSGELRRCCYRRPRATTSSSEAPPWHHRPSHQANQARKPLTIADELGIPKSGHHRSRVSKHIWSLWQAREHRGELLVLPSPPQLIDSCPKSFVHQSLSFTAARTRRRRCSDDQKAAGLVPLESPCSPKPDPPNHPS
jgi:hypothetical protein